MHRLYSVSINWTINPANFLAVDAALTALGADWIRINGMHWFVWTNAGKGRMTQSVQSVTGHGAHCIVVAVHPEAAMGAAPQWIWDWLNDKMQQQVQIQFSGGAS